MISSLGAMSMQSKPNVRSASAQPSAWASASTGHSRHRGSPFPIFYSCEKSAKVSDSLSGSISCRCSDTVNSLPRDGYATCRRLPITHLPKPSIADRRSRSNLPRRGSGCDPFTDVLRDGARELIEKAIRAELAALMASFSGENLDDGRAWLVRRGHFPKREVVTGMGPVLANVPRVRDRKPGADRVTFTPSVLPRDLRKAKSIKICAPVKMGGLPRDGLRHVQAAT